MRSGKVLDSPSGSGEGTALGQWTDDGGDHQRWKLVPSPTSGYYILVIQSSATGAPARTGSSSPCRPCTAAVAGAA